MHEWDGLTLGSGGGLLAGVRQAGFLPDRQGVHVRPQHQDRAWAVLEDSHNPMAAYPSRYLTAGCGQLLVKGTNLRLRCLLLSS